MDLYKKGIRMKKQKGRRAKFSRALFQRVLDRIKNDLQPTVEAILAEGMSKAGFYKAIQREDRDGQMRTALADAQLCRDQVINQSALEEAEAELKTRAVDGWEEPVFHNGELCGTKRKYSDLCLIFLLKALDPAKYREAQVQIHNQVNPSPLPTQAERKKMEADLADMVKGLQARLKGGGPNTLP
jgi:hypothetical protein